MLTERNSPDHSLICDALEPVRGAALAAGFGVALGAGLGAAIGGGQGAAVGAGTGALAGTAIGAGSTQQAQMSLQQRYDIAYTQCMYSRGNQVPGYQTAAPPPPPSAPPPPPVR